MFTLVSLVSASLISVAIAQNTVSLAITAQPTAGASDIISPSFAGFGIESSNLYSFTGGSTSNELTFNLLANLANYTGAPPHLRVGGNTQDYMIYRDSMNDYVVEENPDAVGQGAFPTDHMIIGPRYFQVLNRFPSNTPITFGLNMAYSESDYLDQIEMMANAAYTQLTNLNLVSFEIGNEPDLWLQNDFRSGTWDGQVYTEQWLTRADYVWENVLKSNGERSNFFEPGATASTIGTSFQIQDLVTFGITEQANSSNASYVAAWNQHDYYYYIGVSTYPITLSSFMTWSTTNDQFAAWLNQIVQAADTGYPYALREMGVVGPIGMDGITNIFGASLWTLNFFFYAATLNMSSVQMHMTDNSNASAWQPIDYYGQGPHVRPNYYAFAAFDQIIGGTCQARVGGYVLPDLPEGYDGRIAAYSVYQDETLQSIVLINGMVANATTTDPQTVTVVLSLPTSFAGQTLYLSYLTAPGADSKTGTTWNGISYEENGDGTPTRVNSTIETVQIGNDGSANVPVRDSQAVVANIGSVVGSADINSSACAALAQKTPDAAQVTAPVGTNSANGAYSSATSSSAAGRTAGSASASAASGVARFSILTIGAVTMALGSGFLLLFV